MNAPLPPLDEAIGALEIARDGLARVETIAEAAIRKADR